MHVDNFLPNCGKSRCESVAAASPFLEAEAMEFYAAMEKRATEIQRAIANLIPESHDEKSLQTLTGCLAIIEAIDAGRIDFTSVTRSVPEIPAARIVGSKSEDHHQPTLVENFQNLRSWRASLVDTLHSEAGEMGLDLDVVAQRIASLAV
jgi:hypothetical protein